MTTPSGTGVGGIAGGGSGAAPRREHLELLGSADNLAFLRRHLRSAHPGLSTHDAEDIAVAVLSRLMDRAHRGDWAPQSKPEDARELPAQGRRLGRPRFLPEGEPSTRAITAARVHARSRAERRRDRIGAGGCRHGHCRAGRTAPDPREQDATLFRVLTYLLDVLQQTGARPSNRQVAKACGLSHTGVADALVRGRAYFVEVRNMADPDYRG